MTVTFHAGIGESCWCSTTVVEISSTEIHMKCHPPVTILTEDATGDIVYWWKGQKYDSITIEGASDE